MLRLSCEIKIYRVEDNLQVKQWTIRNVNSVKITADSETFADTCRIEMPKNVKWAQDKDCPIRRGDKVEVWLGYNERMTKRFSGWVRDVKAGVPTVITCEDDVFLLRKVTIKKKLYTNTTINEIIKDIIPETVRVEISGEIKIASWRTTAETVAGEDGEPTLYIYTAWINGRKNAGEFVETKNIISHNLEYRRSEDVKVRIRGVSHMANGTKIEYVEGDGDEVTKNYYNLSMAELQEMVKQEIKAEKWSGLSGAFETFGQPIVRKGYMVDLQLEGVRKARYIVKGVEVKFGVDGYRQEIETQRKVVDL